MQLIEHRQLALTHQQHIIQITALLRNHLRQRLEPAPHRGLVGIHLLLRIHPLPAPRHPLASAIAIRVGLIARQAQRTAQHRHVQPGLEDRLVEVLDHVPLQHAVRITLLQQAQPAAAVVALGEVLADALEAHAQACSHSAQHRSGEWLQLAVRCVHVRHRHALAWIQVLEHPRLELAHALAFVDLIRSQLTLGTGDESHQRTARPSTHQLGLLIALQHVQPHQRRGEPGHASGLPRPLRDEQMDHLISRHPDPTASGPRIAGIGIARMVCIEVVRLRPQVLIHLDAHPHRVAILRLRHIVIDQIVRLQHLQRERHFRVAERPADHPDEHLARLSQAAHHQALNIVETQQPADIAAIFVHPLLERLMDLGVHRLIQLPAAQHPHLTLVPNAVADHVVLDGAQCLPRIVRVTAQLPRTIAQCLEARLNFAIGAGATGHPVAGQPANPRTHVRPALRRPCRLESHRLEQPGAQSHQNLTKRLNGLPRPLAIS